MLSFLQSLGKKKTAAQPAMTRGASMDSALPSSTTSSSSKEDKDSTPATSTGDAASLAFDTTSKARRHEDGSRSLRARRSNVSSYNESVMSGNAKHGYRKKGVGSASRAVSGETLVGDPSNFPSDFARRSTQGLNQDWTLGSLPGDNLNIATQPVQDNKRRSTRLSVLQFASNVMEQTKSVLGKRGREDRSTGTETTSAIKREMGSSATLNTDTPSYEGPVSKRLRLGTSMEDRPSNRTPVQKKPATRRVKKWLIQGLYVGQDPDFDPRFTTAKNKVKKANASTNASKRRTLLPLPMFAGQRMLETGRNFKLPFDVFSPLPPGQPKPDEWKKTHKSRQMYSQHSVPADDM